MFVQGWRLAAVAGLAVALGTGAFAADDDTHRLDLKLKKTDDAAPVGRVDGLGAFTHEARSTLEDDDIEDVFFPYRRGYIRGSYGTGYFGPRTFRFRAGYAAGYYGRPRYYPSYRYNYGYRYNYSYSYRYSYGYRYYTPRYWYYMSLPTGVSQPVGLTYLGCGSSAPSITMEMDRPAMPPAVTEEPAPMPRVVNPRSSSPSPGQVPSYRYDGGPSAPVPMPPADPTPTPKIDPIEGRIVRLSSGSSKLSYPAYGERRETVSFTRK